MYGSGSAVGNINTGDRRETKEERKDKEELMEPLETKTPPRPKKILNNKSPDSIREDLSTMMVT
jgi:hypothetical protein